MQVDVINTSKEKVSTIELPDEVFAAEVNEALMWEQVKAQRASRRRGTHSTKTRAMVRGGGAKPFKQKGTGRARQGSSRSPNLVGGGTVFGPHPRDYSYRLPRSARRSALRSALSMRVQEEALYVLDGFELDAPKTKAVASFVETLGHKSTLIVDAENGNLKLSTRNHPKAKYLGAVGVNVFDILKHEAVVLTKSALDTVVDKAKAASAVNAGDAA